MNVRRVTTATGATLLAAGGIGLITGLPASVADQKNERQASAKAVKSERSVSRQKAARIADRTIERRTGKSARVTGIGREDDYGARWEVEVTLNNGREFDVYVNARGRVVKVIRKGRDSWRSGAAGRDSANAAPIRSVDRNVAAAAALARIEQMTGQNARVTGLEREDDHGARWEVEVTLANGFEYDVYVGADGQVIRVKENRFDDEGDRDDDDWTPGGGDGAGSADSQTAAAAALARIEQMTGQNGRVTGVESEDDHRARWEVEVTLANGFEYDVYVGADGEVIKVKENGFDG